MKKQKTQAQDVLNHFKEHGHITSMEAWSKYHITRLAHVIYTLRKRGYIIRTNDCVGKNEYGTYTYADYTLEGKALNGGRRIVDAW